MTGPLRGVEIRAAVPADAADLAALLSRPGLALGAREVAGRLAAAARAPDGAVLVAGSYGPVVGVLALRWAPSLLEEHPVARIDVLAVDDRERGRGIGRLLVKAGSQAARAAGCDVLVIAAHPRDAASHGFLGAIGFDRAGVDFARPLRRRSRDG